MKKRKDNTTNYGENVCTEFEWLPIDKQKENAEKLANVTQNKSMKDNKKKINKK